MKKCKLGEIADFKTGPFGTQFSSSEYTSTGIPMINIENISNGRLVEEKLQYISKETQKRLSVHAVKEGDIIFGRAGSVDRHLYIFDEYEGYVQGSNCIRMRPTIKVNSRYLSYYLLLPSVKKQIINQSAGSVQAFLNTDKLKSINIVIQDNADKIAKFLDSIESKIFVNNKAICTLESLSKTLYDYYFLQFDFPDEKGRPYKSSGGKMEYNAELGREIPAGWKVDRIGNHLTIDRGISYSSADLKGIGIPMVNLNSFNSDATYKPEGLKTYSGSYSESKLLKPYDLLICTTQQTSIDLTGKTNIIGKALLLPDCFDSKDVVASMDLVRINCDDCYSKHYLRLLLSKTYFHKYITGFAIGTKIKHLHLDGLQNYKCEIPDKNIMSKFDKLVQNIEERKSVVMNENRHLTALRDFLLPLLMNGQVGFKK